MTVEFETDAIFIMPLHGLFSAGFVKENKEIPVSSCICSILYFRSADQQAVLKPLKTYNSYRRCPVQRYLLFHNL